MKNAKILGFIVALGLLLSASPALAEETSRLTIELLNRDIFVNTEANSHANSGSNLQRVKDRMDEAQTAVVQYQETGVADSMASVGATVNATKVNVQNSHDEIYIRAANQDTGVETHAYAMSDSGHNRQVVRTDTYMAEQGLMTGGTISTALGEAWVNMTEVNLSY